ncbi:MAG: hypothetical protein GPJ54_02915 [Candidatus Heimdallarchaeota archaeon]|nr:hypothetical protein [Candidatus Heimdallarchaeota archaeon]
MNKLRIFSIFLISLLCLNALSTEAGTNSVATTADVFDPPLITANITEGSTYSGVFEIEVISSEQGAGFVYVDGSVWANLDFSVGLINTFPYNTFTQAYGSHTFLFEVTDLTGDTGYLTVNVIIKNDFDAPSISVNITDGSTYSGIFDIQVDADEEATGFAYVDGSVWANLDLATKTDVFVFNTFAFSYGTHSFTFELTDTSDNVATLDISVTLKNDFDAPVINVNITNGVTYAGIFDIQVNTDEVASGFAYVDGSVWANLDLSGKLVIFTFNTFAYTDGQHEFIFEAKDESDNVATLSITFIIKNDVTEPIVTADLTDYNTYSGDINIQIDSSEFVSIYVYVDDFSIAFLETDTLNQAFFWLSTTGWSDGIHNVSFSSVDNGNNWYNIDYWVYFKNDFSAPIITTDLIDGATYWGMLDLKIELSEQGAGAIYIDGTLDGTFPTVWMVEYSIDTSLYTNDMHNITIESWDDNGNFDVLSILVYFENNYIEITTNIIGTQIYSGVVTVEIKINVPVTDGIISENGVQILDFSFEFDGLIYYAIFDVNTTSWENSAHHLFAEFYYFNDLVDFIDFILQTDNVVSDDPTTSDNSTTDDLDTISSDATNSTIDTPSTPELPLPGFTWVFTISAFISLIFVYSKKKRN